MRSKSRYSAIRSAEIASDPALAAEVRFFADCGVAKSHLAAAADSARRNATTVEAELIAARRVEPDLYYEWLASHLGLRYRREIDPRQVIAPRSSEILLVREGPLKLASGDQVSTVAAVEARRLAVYRRLLATRPDLRDRLEVARPATIRAAVWAARAEERVRETTRSLAENAAAASARRVLTGTQGYVIALCQAAFLAALAMAPGPTLFALHLALSTFFLLSNMLRMAAAVIGGRPAQPQLPVRTPADLPVYTLLVALRDEAAIVPQLVGALDRINWPKTLLDIKFVCECDDRATIEALRAARPGPQCEIVEVPRYGPATKPKALQYALAGARGSLVAVYDAEDVPHPQQLMEAWTIFQESDDRLACVQAPLVISNARRSWVAALFAVEYGGLFRALVPFLDRFGLPIPLGGTSNHFRRSALEAVGGWDPFNVTEDADLGLRLYRAGYRTRSAHHATVETAPETLPVWLRQRSRWLKGWLQTWLVLMRHPWRAFRDLGPAGFLSVQVLIAGMLASALLHPGMLILPGLAVWAEFAGRTVSGVHRFLWAIDLFNIVGSYCVFVALGWPRLTETEKRAVGRWRLALLPAYWLAMSFAAWRAIRQLPGRPFFWEKTPHPARRSWRFATRGLRAKPAR